MLLMLDSTGGIQRGHFQRTGCRGMWPLCCREAACCLGSPCIMANRVLVELLTCKTATVALGGQCPASVIRVATKVLPVQSQL